ncbi:MAG: sigma-54 dependent transcriptional regulator [Candidatus Zixiibacteriota bacterium]
MARILIVDDEDNIRLSLKSALDRRGHDVVTAADCRQAREFMSAPFEIVFLDVFLPDGSGLDLLKEFLTKRRGQTIVMISGHADIDTAVKAIRLGAHDFIEKPLSLDRIFITLDNIGRTKQLVSERDRLAGRLYGEMVGNSEAVRRIKDDIARSAGKTTRFLILGENGTGKELVAHLIHQQSRNSEGPFVAVNCAALPKELVESELFGHTQGAFTGATQARKGRFQEANGGTIFLDEIGDMSPEAQAKILRVTETKEVSPVGSDRSYSVDCVIIAASNRNLEQLVSEKTFRQDLYYRLNVVTFTLPPLRQRREDIAALAEHFLARFAVESGAEVKRLTADAMSLLMTLEYPGNIRELKNLIERIGIYCEGPEVSVEQLRTLLPPGQKRQVTSLKVAVDDFEQEYIEAALARNGGNVAETARQLGIERSHLYKKIRRLKGE